MEKNKVNFENVCEREGEERKRGNSETVLVAMLVFVSISSTGDVLSIQDCPVGSDL